MYFFGNGVVRDYTRGILAYKIAAEGGHANSQQMLGLLHWIGYPDHGIEKDLEKSYMYSKKAAAQDDVGATVLLGMLAQGEVGGRPSSWRRSRELYQRAMFLNWADKPRGPGNRSLNPVDMLENLARLISEVKVKWQSVASTTLHPATPLLRTL